MNAIEQRVLQIRKSLNLSQADFAKRIGLKQGVISAIEVGRTSLTEQNLKIISLVFGIREEWLRNGTGDMFENERDIIIKEIVDLLQKLTPEARQLVLEYVHLVVSQQQTLMGNASSHPAPV
jgi:transcriptional regulator with XRE-family HTH domain